MCVPLDPATADEFNPEAVPTVGSLLNELNANGSGGKVRGTCLLFRYTCHGRQPLAPLLSVR